MAKAAPISNPEIAELAELRYRLRRFQRASEELCRSEGLTSLQYQLLLQIAGRNDHAWALIGELADRLQAPQHSVGALVTRAQRAGLVERVVSATDRREVQVHLTSSGRRIMRRLAAVHRPELAILANIFRRLRPPAARR